MTDLLRDPAVPFLVLLLGIGAVAAFVMRRSHRKEQRELSNARERFHRTLQPRRSIGDTIDETTGVTVSDALTRMADRYQNSGDRNAADQARAAAQRARTQPDGVAARAAATDYLASVGATNVANAWSALDSSSSTENSVVTSVDTPPDGFRAVDAGSSGTDNS